MLVRIFGHAPLEHLLRSRHDIGAAERGEVVGHTLPGFQQTYRTLSVAGCTSCRRGVIDLERYACNRNVELATDFFVDIDASAPKGVRVGRLS